MKRLIRSLRYGAPVVVISGLPRSGTSMAMKMLEAGGLELVTDEQRTADEDNPKGYYEDERVKELAEAQDRSWVAEARGKGIKVISFLLKDLPKDHFYKVIFMRRDLDEVLASQQKMLERRGEENDISDEQMRELWESHLWRVRYLLKHEKNFAAIEIPYREALAEPAATARSIAEFVGGLDAEKMAAVVDPKLYRNRVGS
jgi:hypothetical protein